MLRKISFLAIILMTEKNHYVNIRNYIKIDAQIYNYPEEEERYEQNEPDNK